LEREITLYHPFNEKPLKWDRSKFHPKGGQVRGVCHEGLSSNFTTGLATKMFDARVIELLFAALGHALKDFLGKVTCHVVIESHGREPPQKRRGVVVVQC
jgi:hypothetical protein